MKKVVKADSFSTSPIERGMNLQIGDIISQKYIGNLLVTFISEDFKEFEGMYGDGETCKDTISSIYRISNGQYYPEFNVIDHIDLYPILNKIEK